MYFTQCNSLHCVYWISYTVSDLKICLLLHTGVAHYVLSQCILLSGIVCGEKKTCIMYAPKFSWNLESSFNLALYSSLYIRPWIQDLQSRTLIFKIKAEPVSTSNQIGEGLTLSNCFVQSTLPLINSVNERPSQFHGFHQGVALPLLWMTHEMFPDVEKKKKVWHIT